MQSKASGVHAFAEYVDIPDTSLSRVVLPPTIKSISGGLDSSGQFEGAFKNAEKLTWIDLPDGVTDISEAFSGCTSLTEINYIGSTKGYCYPWSAPLL